MGERVVCNAKCVQCEQGCAHFFGHVGARGAPIHECVDHAFDPVTCPQCKGLYTNKAEYGKHLAEENTKVKAQAQRDAHEAQVKLQATSQQSLLAQHMPVEPRCDKCSRPVAFLGAYCSPGCCTCGSLIPECDDCKKHNATGFKKFDSDKVRMELLPPAALEQVAKVFTYGARKYSEENYLLGTNYRRYCGAVLRHTWAFMRGEDMDPESGLSHLAHAACNCLMLLELLRVNTGKDDRIKDTRK